MLYKLGVSKMKEVDGLVGGRAVGRLEGQVGVPNKIWCQRWRQKKNKKGAQEKKQ
jgi:hypothetical protein